MEGKQLNLKWVSNVIGSSYKKWRKGDVVKIQAQTGTGKTYFITGSKGIKGLIDYMENCENMIYICNRTELKRQIKLDLCKKFNIEIPYLRDKQGNFILNDKKEKILDENKLDKKSKYNNVVVTSYHAISFGKIENIYLDGKNSLNNFDYIICDECHFFMSDAGYNQKSYLALEELIMTRHRNAIKIFISATMEEVEKVIEFQANKQIEHEFGVRDNTIHSYTTGIDYSYLDINYFKKERDIITTIKNDKTDDKWLIFVTSKIKGENINEELHKLKIKSQFIFSGSNNQEKKNITLNCKFNSKVLISTKCLDNGVNIKDKNVKNIVIMAYDKVTFIQEIGRIRFSILNAPTIKLYIPMFNKKNFIGKVEENYQPKIDDLELFDKEPNKFKAKYNNDYDKAPIDIFYLDKNNNWKVNLLGSGRVYKDRLFANELIADFEDDKFAFIKKQLEWLKLSNTFNENNLIKDIADNEEVESLIGWLESHVGQRLFSDKQQELSNLIIGELTTISKDVDYRTKKLKPSTIEVIIREQLDLKYALKESGNNVNPKTKKKQRWFSIGKIN